MTRPLQTSDREAWLMRGGIAAGAALVLLAIVGLVAVLGGSPTSRFHRQDVTEAQTLTSRAAEEYARVIRSTAEDLDSACFAAAPVVVVMRSR